MAIDLLKLMLMSVSLKPSPLVAQKDDRRREPRFSLSEPEAHLTVMYPLAAAVSSCGIVDVSRTGMRLHVQAPIFPPSRVRIETAKLIIFAEVRYCRMLCQEFYHVGIQIEDVFGKNGHSTELNLEELWPAWDQPSSDQPSE